ncbi:MAG TPA: LPXTG cell wall anchor domain-containing protein [Marmoricola sp.]|nr:LPXTG cell wall anchor domain-containing protein [Marmoricola sp.]
MKKQTTSTGPTGFGWARSLLTFRHGNPVGRLVSTLLAFATAMLLVVGTGAAYADDTAPTPTDTSATADPTPDPATDDSTPPADDSSTPPADDSSTAGTDTPSDAPTDAATDAGSDAATSGSTSSDTTGSQTAAPRSSSGPMMTTLTKLAKPSPNAAPVDITVPCNYQDPGFSIISGFEIDGNLCLTGDATNGTEDWDSVDFSSDAADTVNDGFDDSTTFTNGDSENNDPSTWHINGPTPNGKSDIGTAYAYSKMVGSDVFGYFAFTNTSTSGGTQQYDVEYNQNEATLNGNGATVPTREPGDLLFRFSSIGSKPMIFTDAKIYRLTGDFGADDCFTVTGSNPAGGWCTLDIPPGSFHSAASADGLFQEASIEISAFFAEGTCSGVFGTTQIRSVTGNSFATSALKDYVFPLDVTTPSTCGSLTIEKKDIDTGANVGGGVYEIVGDPRPGANPDDTLCIYDGPDSGLAAIEAANPSLATECDTLIADGAADGTVDVGEVEPGTYTVNELVPPPGYLLNPGDGNTQQVTIGEGDPATVTFRNHKQWAPLSITKSADGTFGATYTWGITKQIAPTADGPWTDHPDANDPLVKNVEAGGDTNLYYRVQVTQESVTPADYVVSGTIHVGNTNDASVAATLTESLSGCTLDSNHAAFPVDVTVPAGGADFDYTCDLGNGPETAGTNNAHVSWDKSTYPQSTDDLTDTGSNTLEASDGYTFAETASVDKTITVTDDHFDFDPAWVITWGDEADGTYDSPVYSYDTQATAGTCSAVVTNTATITGDGNDVLTQTSENGQVCVEADLSVGVTSLETLTRAFQWDIDKSTTTPTITVANGQATAHYKVVITALPYVDSGWEMSGTVTITNPNDFTDKQVSSLDIAYSGGGTCAPSEALPNVPAGQSVEVDFDCDFGNPATQPAYIGDVTATVHWDADAESASDPTPWSVTEADWLSGASLANQFIKVFDDHAIPGNQDPLFNGTQLKWQDVYDSTDPADHQVDVEYNYTFPASSLPAAGACKSFTNTAWFTGDDPEQSLGSDDATVRVCTPAVAPPIVSPPEVLPPSLPNTGGPDAWLMAAGLGLVLAGGLVLAAERRRKRRS